MPVPSDDEVDEWLAAGYNLGVATGHGFIVVDIDLPEIPPEFPATLTVKSGRGWHLYYAIAPGLAIRNSAGKLGQNIDVRGQGGQVVIPPSRHVNGMRYTWYSDVPMTPLPEWIERACKAQGKWIEVDWSRLNDAPPQREWGQVALAREVARVQGTPEGGRNDQLFRSAASLTEIVNGGRLGLEEVETALTAAALASGLPEAEIRAVLKSARAKVGTKARTPKPREQSPSAPTSAPGPVPDHLPPASALATVLIPGAHVDDHGEYVEVTPNDFSTVLLACQPPHTLFHRAGVAGSVRDGAFVPLNPAGMRLRLVAKPYKWVQPKPTINDPAPTARKVYVPLTKEHAELAIARAIDHANVLEIRTISHAPVFLADWSLSRPGWNVGGVYQTGPALRSVPAACLRDLLIDFPFQEEADRENFIGLMVTILIRSALGRGNVPMHLILSTIPRTGKTRLVDEILGILFLGGPVPAMQFSGTDEERDKRVLAVLMLGLPIIHLDNLGEWLDSPSLTSTLTASVYSGRRLGASEIIHVPNLGVWVGTGNNVAMSDELAKRTVPIRMRPLQAAPHLRTDFVHSDLLAYVTENRDGILQALVAMVSAWLAAGQPGCDVRIGGFETWCAKVGGIMRHAGYTEWMTNYAEWTGSADVEGGDMIRFMEDWQVTWQGGNQRVGDLRKRAVELGLFERRFGRTSTERGQDSATGTLLRRYLRRAVSTQYGKFCVVEKFVAGVRMYALERQS